MSHRSLLESALAALPPTRRGRLAIALEIVLVVTYVIIRATDLEEAWLIGWTIAIGVTSVIAPISGLTVLMLVAPFPEWIGLGKDAGMKLVLVLLLGLGVGLRMLLGRGRIQLPAPVALAIVLWSGLGLTALHTLLVFGPDLGQQAILRWLAGIGAGMVIFVVAFWAARQGAFRPLYAAVGGVVAAAVVNLIELIRPEWIRTDWLGWTVRHRRTPDRITAILNGPNAIATLTSATLAVVVAALVERRERVRAWLLPVGLLLATVVLLTYSRSGILAMFLIAVVAVARHRPRGAAVLLVSGIALFIVLTPAYLQLRAAALGSTAVTDLGSLLSGDVKRWTGWTTGLRLWAESPLIGSGFLSFLELRTRYNVTVVSHPHNELIRLLAEGGLLAASAFVAFVVLTVRSLWRDRSWVGLAGTGAMVALLTGAMFNNPFYFTPVMVLTMGVIGQAVGHATLVAAYDPGVAEHSSAAGP